MATSTTIPPNAVRIEPLPGPQRAFLRTTADIAFYGGAAGGGKTFALLLEPLYDIGNKDFGAVIFRRTTKQITAEGGLWDTAGDMYAELGASPNLTALSWTFRSGARITFAHMEHEKNRLDWQGAQIPLIEFDELTHFTWPQFSYMLSRNRSVSGAQSRIRATLNPDADHWTRKFVDWWIGEDGLAIRERSGVVRWFIVEDDVVVWGASREKLESKHPECLPKSFTFIPAGLDDNPILTTKDPTYRSSLLAMPRVERERLLGGNWNIRPQAGEYFQRSWFPVVDEAIVPRDVERVRSWDLAASEKARSGDDPSWTVGMLVSRCTRTGRFYIEHVERLRESAGKVKQTIVNTASRDPYGTVVRLPQDPGQAGKAQVADFVNALAGHRVVALPVSGDKVTRAGPASSQAEAGNISVVRAYWNDALFAELEAFPAGHDDQVDALADGIAELTGNIGVDYSQLTSLGSRDFEQESPWTIR